MVVSKRCKVCTVIEPENIPISGEYFGKLLPDLILKISGIDLDPRKSNGVLICKSCAVQLVHTDLLVDKLRNTLQRLKKLVKETKIKTFSKDSSSIQNNNSDAKNTSINNVDQENLDKSETGEIDSLTKSNESKSQDEIKPKTPKKVARRKSVFPDDKKVNCLSVSEENVVVPNTATSTDKIDSAKKLKESKTQDEIKPKTVKKVVRRKSVFPDDQQMKNNDVAKENMKTPNTVTSAKFNKILCDDKATPIKQTPVKASKRKVTSSTKNDLNNTIDNNQSDLVESTPLKRNKTKSMSESEDFPIDLTFIEQDDNASNNETTVIDGKAKVMNCSICDKVFHQKSALRVHIETSHMGERLKSCPHCSSEFRSLQKYESHVFSEKCKSTNHPCQYPNCNKRFKTVHKMELHMQEKHSSQNDSEEY